MLKEKINNDLKTALLGGNRFLTQVLRGLKAVILDAEVAQSKRDTGLDDAAIEQLLAKEVKKRKESANIYEASGRSELAKTELEEAEAIAIYLPKQLDESEISKSVSETIKKMGVSGPSAMGQVIGAVKKELGNTADGALIAKIVKDLLKN